ncbi:hypothetical protein Q8A67_024006 [Cirrhinus molitorella]|uniref:Uncharacterized protein n=1 Tax=Cirrhinus molitorella TaxID=172907 RepID=A0AA88TLH4_9TELE|nr:hypothetical protein Q8A67_024006 [Cirrhinus molitorella]
MLTANRFLSAPRPRAGVSESVLLTRLKVRQSKDTNETNANSSKPWFTRLSSSPEQRQCHFTVSPHLVLRPQPDGAQQDGLQMGGREKKRERAAGHTLLNPLRAALCFQPMYLNEERDTGLLPPLCSDSQGIWKSGRLTGKSPYDPNVIQDPIQIRRTDPQ